MIIRIARNLGGLGRKPYSMYPVVARGKGTKLGKRGKSTHRRCDSRGLWISQCRRWQRDARGSVTKSKQEGRSASGYPGFQKSERVKGKKIGERAWESDINVLLIPRPRYYRAPWSAHRRCDSRGLGGSGCSRWQRGARGSETKLKQERGSASESSGFQQSARVRVKRKKERAEEGDLAVSLVPRPRHHRVPWSAHRRCDSGGLGRSQSSRWQRGARGSETKLK